MARGKPQSGWHDFVIYTIAYFIAMALSPVPSLRLLWMAGILATVPIYIYLRSQQIAWGYLIMVAALAIFAGLVAIHPGLPWLFLVPLIFVGFVIAPVIHSLRQSRGQAN